LDLLGPPPALPTGLVFSCFMLCITLGGLLFEISVQTKMLTENVAVSTAYTLYTLYAHSLLCLFCSSQSAAALQ
jgi:hypothetical protein